MKKKIIALMGMAVISCALLMGCGSKTETPAAETTTEAENSDEETAKTEETAEPEKADAEEAAAATLEDGIYTADFNTDSSMFHVNEACNGRATLTVKDGKMTVHITLVSKNIENVFLGTAEDAQKDGAELIQPTIDKVTYSDGMTEEVYGFNVPVEKLDEEFDLAIIGKKGKWYDHKVSVTDVQEQTEEEKNAVEIGEEEKSEDADTTTDAAAEEENKD